MDLITKIFLYNWILICVVTRIDYQFFDSQLIKTGLPNDLTETWMLICLISTPLWIIYFIVTIFM